LANPTTGSATAARARRAAKIAEGLKLKTFEMYWPPHARASPFETRPGETAKDASERELRHGEKR
jgi:hypothetical protein